MLLLVYAGILLIVNGELIKLVYAGILLIVNGELIKLVSIN